MLAGLLNFLVVVIAVGGVLYIVSLLPINETVKKVATVVVILIAAVWALRWLAAYLH